MTPPAFWPARRNDTPAPDARDRKEPRVDPSETPHLSGEYRRVAERRGSSSAEWRAVAAPPTTPVAAGPPTFVRRKSGTTSAVRPGQLSAPSADPAAASGSARRHVAVQMAAVLPRSSSRGLVDDSKITLHLDVHADDAVSPASSQVIPASIGLPSAQRPLVGESSWAPPSNIPRRSSATRAAVDVHASLVAFAGFGDPPSSRWAAPAYAARVVLRRRVLTDGLRRARACSSHDIGVYEAALRTADDVAVRQGILVASLLATLVALVMFAGVALAVG